MDVRKKNTYEVLDMIEKNLISESDIIYYIENDYLDNQLLEDVMDTMFSEASAKDWILHPLDTAAESARQRYAGKGENFSNSVGETKRYVDPMESIALKKALGTKTKEEIPSDAFSTKEGKIPDSITNNTFAAKMEKLKNAQNSKELSQSQIEAIKNNPSAPGSVDASSINKVTHSGGRLDANGRHYRTRGELEGEANAAEEKAKAAAAATKKVEAPKQVEPVKPEAPKQTETKVETNNSGHTETPKTSNDEHADGIWEKIKGGYHTIKKAAGEHLEHAKQYAMEHPGIAGAAAAGAAVAGLAAYAGYKHLKNKKALASAHEDAHKAAMDSISKTHGHLSGAAAAHIHNDIHNVINSNKEMFKKDPRKSKEQLINHFGSDEYKKHLVSKLSK